MIANTLAALLLTFALISAYVLGAVVEEAANKDLCGACNPQTEEHFRTLRYTRRMLSLLTLMFSTGAYALLVVR